MKETTVEERGLLLWNGGWGREGKRGKGKGGRKGGKERREGRGLPKGWLPPHVPNPKNTLKSVGWIWVTLAKFVLRVCEQKQKYPMSMRGRRSSGRHGSAWKC